MRDFLQERDGGSREEVGSGRRKEGGEKGQWRGEEETRTISVQTPVLWSNQTIVSVFLMTVNSPVTVEVSKVEPYENGPGGRDTPDLSWHVYTHNISM